MKYNGLENIEIHNQIEYDKISLVECKMEELAELVEDLNFSGFKWSLDGTFYKDMEMLFSAREKYDKQRLKNR